MKLIRNSKLILLSAVLALGGLAFAATAAPAAHAACTTSFFAYGQGGGVKAYGTCFNPYATVRVELMTNDISTVLATTYVTADSSGSFATLLSTNYVGNVYVSADGSHPGTIPGRVGTLWGHTYVYPAPYLEAWEEIAVGEKFLDTTGSGFIPGGLVKVCAWDSNWNGLGCQYVTAVQSGINAGIIEPSFDLHYYSGIVRVYAQQIYPFVWNSNGVTVYFN
jgi:hypothetical protein